jgi:hypothetical protein
MDPLYQKTTLDGEGSPGRNYPYYAYLLRVWYEEGCGWRVSLQPTHTQERFGFADLYSAMSYVEQVLLEGNGNES